MLHMSMNCVRLALDLNADARFSLRTILGRHQATASCTDPWGSSSTETPTGFATTTPTPEQFAAPPPAP